MRLLLLLIPLMLCSAQNDIDVITSWLNQNGVSTQRTLTLEQTGGGDDCTTTDGKDGICVEQKMCLTPVAPTNDPTTNFVPRASGCATNRVCCALNNINSTPSPSRSLPPGCGWSNPGGVAVRSIDDDNTSQVYAGTAEFGEYPWMVALLTKSYGQTWSPNDYLGGGILIHPAVVLTVAHKLDSRKPNEIKCRAGEWDFQTESEIYLHQDRNVRKFSIHPDYVGSTAHYDAALLFLEAPFKLKDVYHIGVACLAQDMPAPGTLCYSMGWGSSFNNTNNTSLLKKIKLPIVDSKTCERQLQASNLGSNYHLHTSLSCAGGIQGADTCVGDGGSSLVCPIKGGTLHRYAVYGMVAYGVDCGLADMPGVYAKIRAMTDWIDGEMMAEQLSTTSYYAAK